MNDLKVRINLGLSALGILIIALSGCHNSRQEDKLFALLSSKETGIDFSNTLEETHKMNIITYPDFYSGGGVAIGDIDNDGLSDILFTGNQVPCRLYKNKGKMVFEDITTGSRLDQMEKGWFTGATMIDLNTDGFLDIYICQSGMEAPEDRSNLLFINNRDGTFTEKAREYGLDNAGHGVNAVYLDYDKDGDLDVYVANQVSSRLNSSQTERLRSIIDPIEGDKLYENIGGRFIDVSEKCGIYSSLVGFAHGAAVGDINEDGWEDLFVSNDFFEYDYLYLNNGDKTFTESIKRSTRHISNFSMGNDLADYNNDGLLDLFVLDMVAEDNRRLYANTGGMDEMRFARSVQYGLHYQYMFNVLHMNNGNETFSEIGMLAGISRTDWSWAPLLADFDNDGFKDLYITNGIRKDIRNIDWGYSYRSLTQFVSDFTKFEPSQWDMLLSTLPYEPVVNYMFRNNGDLTFSKVMKEWGFDRKSYSNGVAYGDLDNDGDLDLVVNNVDAEAFVYENRKRDSNYLRFKFTGPAKNPMALGTKIRVYHGDQFQYQQHYTSRGYRSCMEPVMHFGLGKDSLVQKVEVVWPDGKFSMLTDLKSNQVIHLKHSEAVGAMPETMPETETFFEDLTGTLRIQIRHRENEMNDFINEPMLPYKLSSLGPALAVSDVNGDGLDDFYLGGSFRYAGQLYIQNPNGKFQASQADLWNEDRLFEDTGAVFFDIDNDGDPDLYIVSGGIENTIENQGLRDRLYLNDGQGLFSKSKHLIPDLDNSGSVAEAADFDEDGDQDLFIGGRLIPGKYPFAADSYLLKNQNGKLENISDELAPELRQLGLVTDAVWSDYDGDADLDLLITGEWMPVTIFRNEGGRFHKVENENNGLEYTAGWWWSIDAHDLDNDGDEDYILGNMGLNYKFRASQEEPLELFIGDFDGNDRFDFVIGYHQDGKIYPTADKTKTVTQHPFLKRKIPSHDAYAVFTLIDIYGAELLEKAENRKIYRMESGYLENKGNGTFLFKAFDNYAQISTVNSSLIRDVDRDGNFDLILAGNLYNTEAETIRLDAGIGVWMKGDGKGNFKSTSFSKSGLYLEGDVRALRMVMAHDRPLLLAAKNNDLIQLIGFKNPLN